MKKVSVIVPTYNNECYLDECLDSIINQTYKNIEVIIVNDGSTDKTLEKLQIWQKKFPKKIKCYTNPNHGVSYSRNYGIKKSQGQYLTFVDADDVIKEDFIETLVRDLEESNSDCSVCGIKGFYENVEMQIPQNNNQLSFYYKSQTKDTLLDFCGGFLANKIYKAKIIKEKHLWLDEKIAISEDLLFNLAYFNYCEKITFNPSIKYFYRQYHNSSYNNLQNQKWFSVLDMYNQILCSKNLLQNLNKTKVITRLCFTLAEAKYRKKFILKNSTEIENKINVLSHQYITLKNFKNMNLTEKIKLILLLTMPSLVMKYKRRKIK